MRQKVPHTSQALKGIVEALARRENVRILDLGTASGQTVSFLSQYGTGLSILDLRRSLSGGDDRPVRLEEALALPQAGDNYDLVLAWDLFDYLDDAGRELLGNRLAEITRPSGRVFSLISYREEIPECPRQYWLLQDDRIVYEEPDGPTRPSPRLKELQLMKALPGFSVEGSYLLRNGVQEYVFYREREAQRQYSAMVEPVEAARRQRAARFR